LKKSEERLKKIPETLSMKKTNPLSPRPRQKSTEIIDANSDRLGAYMKPQIFTSTDGNDSPSISHQNSNDSTHSTSTVSKVEKSVSNESIDSPVSPRSVTTSNVDFKKFPIVDRIDMKIPYANQKQTKFGGILKKMSTGLLTRGMMQERWFYIDLEIKVDENYILNYSRDEDDEKPRNSYPLQNASVKINDKSVTLFDISTEGGEVLHLEAFSTVLRDKWVSTIESVINIANQRTNLVNRL
jgi:hypothetical protein